VDPLSLSWLRMIERERWMMEQKPTVERVMKQK
jgi:hypothetical protein